MGGGPPGHFFGATPVEVKTAFFAEKGRILLRGKFPASTGVAHSLVSGGAPTHTFLFQHLEFWPKPRVRRDSGATPRCCAIGVTVHCFLLESLRCEIVFLQWEISQHALARYDSAR